MDQPQASRTGVVQDYLDALGVLRSLRNVVAVLLVIVLGMQIWLYLSARNGRLVLTPPCEVAATAVEPVAVAAPEVPATQAVGDQAAELVEADAVADGPTYHESCVRGVRIALPIARFVGLVSAGLLVVCLFVGLFVCLNGRLGGIPQATAGLMWAVLLVLVLFPWQSLLGHVDVDVPAAFMTFDQLQAVPDADPDGTVAIIAHYVRFIGWPSLAILLTLIAFWRFGAACKAVRSRLTAE